MSYADRIDRHLRCYLCIHVAEDVRPILLVDHAGGTWSFLCGDTHPQDQSSIRVAGIGHILDRDPTIIELMDLPVDWEAERKDVKSAWIRTKIDDPDA